VPRLIIGGGRGLKLIIAGSRHIKDYGVVRQAVIVSGFWKKYKHELEIVCGMAPGIDLLGKEFAEKNGLKVHEFPADWNGLGKKAGHVRNAQMGKFALEAEDGGALLAVWDGVSPGTKNMITWADAKGLEWFVYRPDKPSRYLKIGASIRTDFSGKWTAHTIADIENKGNLGHSQSGIMFLVDPPVPKSGGGWVDADWFVPG
jgi:hypothetical protein